MTTKEQLFEEFEKKGVVAIDCNEKFIEQHIQEISDLLFYKKITSTLFNAAIERGIKKISIDSCEEQWINYGFDRNKTLMYAYHNWFMIVQLDKKRMFLYQIS